MWVKIFRTMKETKLTVPKLNKNHLDELSDRADNQRNIEKCKILSYLQDRR